MQEETSGITVRDIFKTIWSQKWLALIIAVVITVGGVLAIQLGYNKGQEYYSSQFSLVLPDEGKDETKYTYPDGTPFQYADMVAYKALSAVKQSNESFASIDVETMAKKGNISVIRSANEVDGVTYTLTAKATYFSDYNLAREFLIALANVPVNYRSQMNVDFDVYISLSADAEDYESQISLLNAQLDYLVKEFEDLIKSYGGNFVVNGKTLSSYYNEIKAHADKNNLEILLAKVKKDGILKSEKLEQKYKEQIIDIERQYDIAKFTLDNLLNLVAELDKQKQEYQNYIDNGTVNPDFETTSIKPEYDKIKGYTDTLTNVVTVVYEKASSVSFTSVNAVSLSGGMGMLTSVLLCLIVGVIVAGVAAYVVGAKKQKSKQTEEVASESEAAQTENTVNE